MTRMDFGKSAICGVNGQEVIITKYNFKCPCLNCGNCANENLPCPWRYVLETNPCTNEDIRATVCRNCTGLQR